MSDVSLSFIPAGWHPGANRQEMKDIQSSGDGQIMIEAEGTGGVNSYGASRNSLICDNPYGQSQGQRTIVSKSGGNAGRCGGRIN